MVRDEEGAIVAQSDKLVGGRRHFSGGDIAVSLGGSTCTIDVFTEEGGSAYFSDACAVTVSDGQMCFAPDTELYDLMSLERAEADVIRVSGCAPTEPRPPISCGGGHFVEEDSPSWVKVTFPTEPARVCVSVDEQCPLWSVHHGTSHSFQRADARIEHCFEREACPDSVPPPIKVYDFCGRRAIIQAQRCFQNQQPAEAPPAPAAAEASP